MDAKRIVIIVLRWLDIMFKKEPIFDEGTRENNNTIYLDALGAQIENVAIDDFETKPCINWYSGRCISKHPIAY